MKISNSAEPSQSTVPTDTSAAQANLSPTLFYNLILQMLSEPPAQASQVPQPSQSAQPLPQAELTQNAVMPTMPAVPTHVEETSVLSNTAPLLAMAKPASEGLDDHPVMSQLNFVQQTLPSMSSGELPMKQAIDDKINMPEKIELPNKMPENGLSNTIPPAAALLSINTNEIVKNVAAEPVSHDQPTSTLLSDKLMPVTVSSSKPVGNPASTPVSNQAAKKTAQPSPAILNSMPAEGIFATKSSSIDPITPMSDAVEMMQSTSLNVAHAQSIAENKAAPSQNQLALQAFTQISHFIHSYTLPSETSLSSTPTVTATAKDAVLSSQQSMASRYEPQIDVVASSIGPFLKESYDAKIKIYPPDLGSVLAKLKIEKGSAQLVLLTENARVKEIVEANLSQLHQQFKDADISLTQVQVQSSLADFTDQSGKESDGSAPKMTKENTDNTEQKVISSNESPKDSNQIIDTYA